MKINKMNKQELEDALKKTAEHQGNNNNSSYAKALLARLANLQGGNS